MTNALDNQYQPSKIEQAIYQRWESNNNFAAREAENAYCIMIPPPNVTGSLHMGHAFQDTIMDLLTRYHRMKGDQTLWQVGTDHAGIATQMVVERRLAADGISRHDLGREKFIDKVWEWKAESGGTITKQLRRMGAAIDWSRERFTMDDGLSAAVQEVFIKLYQEDLIYRGKRLVNWDPVLHTAVSDLEVESAEENGHLWHLRYPLSDAPDQFLIVATTRPETMLGDSAVAVHPEDERYQHLIGKTIDLPLTSRRIPVIADEYVDPEFGSGCVKITPAHDFNDYDVGKRHDLEIINILDKNAAIDLPNSPYHGLDRYVARKKIVADFEVAGLLERIDDHKLMVPRGDRSGSVIEPYLTDQWYVRVEPLAKEAIKVVEDGDIKFVPENWQNTYFEWMRNIEDWCISRQIWWGHRVPAWYDQHDNIYVAASLEEAQQQAGPQAELRQDTDVLDTWFSSALWPFSTLGWPDNTPELDKYYPTNVLVTGFDIIFFWVARMVMFGLKFTGKVPFKEVYIHGLVRDQEGQKMSKSKGNVLDPIDLIDGIDLETLVAKRTHGLMQPKMAAKIEKATRKQFPDGIAAFGTDALRFTFASQATLGRDIRFDLARVEGYRNFCNKLWNASRYVLMNTSEHDCGQSGDEYELSLADRWIISRLQQVEQDVTAKLESYRFDQVAQSLYSFVWDEYCSWYVELTKTVLNDGNASAEQLRGTRRTLVRVLETTLRLLHPIMPFISEEIWQQVKTLAACKGETIMDCDFPVADISKVDQAALDEMHWVQAVITGVRNVRGEMNISPSKALPILLEGADQNAVDYLQRNRGYLTKFGRFESIDILPQGESTPESATALVDEMRVLIPLGSFIDAAAEIKRLTKDLEKAERDIAGVKGRLSNSAFVDKAPEAVIAKAKKQLADAESAKRLLLEQIDRMQQFLTT
ncbi:valine--tRNA ligase [Arenicella chitinivorans]|uniref:Valine--tRNA ligase n=1 Tax=Arenicella chitinivorans TaxID=1329800 RepID=A0A918VMB1_9GAMM|nr:valine--tRNA ligase [Arenicella chitinivorans]GHA08812.1 valine--tRNA ligase [Arenicella chitinivorans]